MSDLDDEELEATRKLNGVAKESDIDDNYNRNEVKKEEFYKRQVYEELLEKK